MPVAVANHIWVDERGFAWIDQTNVKVVEVVADKLAHNSSAEEMHFQYPHLSLSQIYAALTYYYDHKPEVDAQISASLAKYEGLKAAAAQEPFSQKFSKKRKA